LRDTERDEEKISDSIATDAANATHYVLVANDHNDSLTDKRNPEKLACWLRQSLGFAFVYVRFVCSRNAPAEIVRRTRRVCRSSLVPSSSSCGRRSLYPPHSAVSFLTPAEIVRRIRRVCRSPLIPSFTPAEGVRRIRRVCRCPLLPLRGVLLFHAYRDLRYSISGRVSLR